MTDPFVAWAQQRGLLLAQNVSTKILGGIPGIPFGEYSQKKLAYAAWGPCQGMPALALRMDYRWTSVGSGPSGAGSSRQSSHLCIAVLEAPAPLPALAVHKRMDVLTKIGSIRYWGKLFQSEGVQISAPEMARYRIDAKNEQFARWFMTPEVFAMVLPQQETSRQHLLQGMRADVEFFFQFVGRKIVVWSKVSSRRVKASNGADYMDACLNNAFWLYHRIPQNAYNDPSGVEADRASVPVQQLVSQL